MSKSYSRAPLALLSAAVLATGCSDTLGVTTIPNPSEPSEVTLTDFGSGSLLDPAAFDLLNDQVARTDQTQDWDFLFAFGEDGTATLRPRTAVTSETSDAGLQKAVPSFEEAVEAPRTGYVLEESIPVKEGDVLFGVSRRNRNLALRCRLFARFEVLEIDVAAAVLRLRYLRNPNCEQTHLALGDG